MHALSTHGNVVLVDVGLVAVVTGVDVVDVVVEGGRLDEDDELVVEDEPRELELVDDEVVVVVDAPMVDVEVDELDEDVGVVAVVLELVEELVEVEAIDVELVVDVEVLDVELVDVVGAVVVDVELDEVVLLEVDDDELVLLDVGSGSLVEVDEEVDVEEVVGSVLELVDDEDDVLEDEDVDDEDDVVEDVDVDDEVDDEVVVLVVVMVEPETTRTVQPVTVPGGIAMAPVS
jgi:hypothetical protein